MYSTGNSIRNAHNLGGNVFVPDQTQQLTPIRGIITVAQQENLLTMNKNFNLMRYKFFRERKFNETRFCLFFRYFGYRV